MPTAAELDAERNVASSAFDSALKLPVAGYRLYSDGSLGDVSSYGRYWTSTVGGTHSRFLFFSSGTAVMHYGLRAYGRSVRCLKD